MKWIKKHENKRADLLCITDDPQAKEKSRAILIILIITALEIYEEVGMLLLDSPITTEKQATDQLAE